MASNSATLNVEQQIDRQPMGGYQMWVVFLGGLILFIDGLDVQLVSYIGPKILKEWAISRTVLGAIFSSMIWGLLVGFAFVAPLSIRFGHRPLILWNMILFSLATMACYFVNDPTTMIALRVIAGVGLAGVIPSGVALTGEFGPKRRRSTCIALIYCGYSFGTMAAGLIAGQIIEHYGWRVHMAVGGFIPLAIAAFLYFTLPESPEFLISRGASRDKIAALVRRIAPSAPIDANTVFTVNDKREGALAVAQLFTGGRALGTLMLWLALFMNLMVIFFVLQWLPSDKVLSVGIVDGRNIWRTDLDAALASSSTQSPRASLVLTENTHVHSGGTVVPLDDLRAIRAIADRRKVTVHLDGSRIWNAAAYLKVPAREIAATAHKAAQVRKTRR